VQPTWDAEVSTEVLPTLTLSYFLNKNIAVELFCCFAKLNAEVERWRSVANRIHDALELAQMDDPDLQEELTTETDARRA